MCSLRPYIMDGKRPMFLGEAGSKNSKRIVKRPIFWREVQKTVDVHRGAGQCRSRARTPPPPYTHPALNTVRYMVYLRDVLSRRGRSSRRAPAGAWAARAVPLVRAGLGALAGPTKQGTFYLRTQHFDAIVKTFCDRSYGCAWR